LNRQKKKGTSKKNILFLKVMQ